MLTTVFESYKYSHRHPCVPSEKDNETERYRAFKHMREALKRVSGFFSTCQTSSVPSPQECRDPWALILNDSQHSSPGDG